MYKIEISRENANDDNVIITNIHVKNYQQVNKGDILFEFETSKTLVEIEAERDGIVSLNIEIGQTVPIGWTAAVIDNNEFHFVTSKKFKLHQSSMIVKAHLRRPTFSIVNHYNHQTLKKIIFRKTHYNFRS